VKKTTAILLILLLSSTSVGCSRLAAELPLPSAAKVDQPISASGIIQAEEVSVTAELGGQVVAVLVQEGAEVAAGAPLILLDDVLIMAKIHQAEAALATARAELEKTRAGPRPAVVRAAEAALAQATAVRQGAKQVWQNAKLMLDNPQELRLRIEEARTQLFLAEQGVEQARANLAKARNLRDTYPDPSSERYIHNFLVGAAEEEVKAAERDRDATQAALHGLLRMLADPLPLKAEVRAAEAAHRKAEAAVEVAEASVVAARAQARPEELALREAQIEQAEAALEVLRVQQAKLTLKAPRSGLVTRVTVHPGETSLAGTAAMTIADLNHVELKIYVQERDLGRVWLGQGAQVTVDTFPGRIFEGHVIHIASKAEFTSKSLETADERAQTVFAVRISLPNPDHALKPGMPADARLGE